MLQRDGESGKRTNRNQAPAFAPSVVFGATAGLAVAPGVSEERRRVGLRGYVRSSNTQTQSTAVCVIADAVIFRVFE
jgi:hypothetical protein